MHIRVIKSDHTVESYLHTKVLGTFHNALSGGGQGDLYVAEQLAEAMTFCLYRQGQPSRQVSTEEIYLMMLSVLRDTGHGRAADVLHQHRLERKLHRKRLEIVEGQNGSMKVVPWDKAEIVEELIGTFQIQRPLARVIAGAVEEKVLRMGMCRVSRSLLNELIAADLEAMVQAEGQLAG